MLFLYLLITILIYLTNDKVSTYMVTSGTLSTNENYNALVLRTEEVVTANVDGYATYYVQDGTKSSKNDVIMSIGSTKAASRRRGSPTLRKRSSRKTDFRR